MTLSNQQELQIIQAFSSVDVPERIIRDSNIKELLHGMSAEQDAVQSDALRLERLRQEKKDGNFVGNWWSDRDDKVQDAQIDLNKSIGRLTQKSSQLLIVNTAISKVLNDQQRILLEQQNILKRQTDTLEEQNRKILEQQNLLEKQQQDINKANQGLLEAKGITQEQAQQLVGCVKLVKEAENRINADNQALRLSVEQYLHDSVERCLGQLSSGLAEQEQRYSAFGQQLTTAFSTQSQHSKAELARFAEDSAEFKADIGQQLQLHIETVLEKLSLQDATVQQVQEAVKGVERKQEHVQNEQTQALKAAEVHLVALRTELQKSANSNRLALSMVAVLAVASLSWQVAQHFGLV